MKRIFIAIKIDPDEIFLNMISSLKSGLINESIKWTNLDNFHLTMTFLGDTEDDTIKLIDSKLKEGCEGYGNFELILEGAGVFRNFNDPRIIWTGIILSERLTELNNIIIHSIREAGLIVEERPFKPHMTLGRVKFIRDKAALKVLLEKYRETEIQKVPVNEVILYESILKPTGPLYKPVSIIRL